MKPSPTILRRTPPATTPTLSHSPGGGSPKKVSAAPTRSLGGGRKPNTEAVETTPTKSIESTVEHGVQQCALNGCTNTTNKLKYGEGYHVFCTSRKDRDILEAEGVDQVKLSTCLAEGCNNPASLRYTGKFDSRVVMNAMRSGSLGVGSTDPTAVTSATSRGIERTDVST